MVIEAYLKKGYRHYNEKNRPIKNTAMNIDGTQLSMRDEDRSLQGTSGIESGEKNKLNNKQTNPTNKKSPNTINSIYLSFRGGK